MNPGPECPSCGSTNTRWTIEPPAPTAVGQWVKGKAACDACQHEYVGWIGFFAMPTYPGRRSGAILNVEVP